MKCDPNMHHIHRATWTNGAGETLFRTDWDAADSLVPSTPGPSSWPIGSYRIEVTCDMETDSGDTEARARL